MVFEAYEDVQKDAKYNSQLTPEGLACATGFFDIELVLMLLLHYSEEIQRRMQENRSEGYMEVKWLEGLSSAVVDGEKEWSEGTTDDLENYGAPLEDYIEMSNLAMS